MSPTKGSPEPLYAHTRIEQISKHVVEVEGRFLDAGERNYKQGKKMAKINPRFRIRGISMISWYVVYTHR